MSLRKSIGWGVLFCLCMAWVPGQAQLSSDDAPQEIREISFDQKLGESIPLDLEFRDSDGKLVKLSDFFQDGKPVVLALVYYRCPMLCNLIMNGMLEVFQNAPYTLGSDYKALNISFNADETHVLAAQKKQNYVETLDPEVAAGWHFMVGDQAAIDRLADAVGFSYKYIPEADEYAHRSGILFITPEGVISRYLPGVRYDDREFRFGLVDASDGKIGSLADKLFLLCYHFDPTAGTYNLLVNRLVNGGAALTVLLVAGMILLLIRREKRIRARLRADDGPLNSASTP